MLCEYVYEYVYSMCVGVHKGQKKAIDPLELEV